MPKKPNILQELVKRLQRRSRNVGQGLGSESRIAASELLAAIPQVEAAHRDEIARLLEPMEKLAIEMRTEALNCMHAWETGDVVARDKVETWSDELEAAIRTAKGKVDG